MKKMVVANMEESLTKREGMGSNRVNTPCEKATDGGMKAWIRSSSYKNERMVYCMYNIRRMA